MRKGIMRVPRLYVCTLHIEYNVIPIIDPIPGYSIIETIRFELSKCVRH